jgi:2-keto-4-pentenoate hydratase
MRRKRPGVRAGRAARLTSRVGVAAEAAAHRRPTAGWTARTTSAAIVGHPAAAAAAAARSAGAAQVGVALRTTRSLLSAAYSSSCA